jgi:DNA-binding response OmpR family regulator
VRLVFLSAMSGADPDHLSDQGFAAQISKPLVTTRLADGLVRAMRIRPQPNVEPIPATSSPAPALAAGARVLVATSANADGALIRDVLRQLGCGVTLARTGRAASELMQREPFTLVLMDCLLPDVGAFDLVREPRRDQEGHHPPIIGLLPRSVGVDRDSCLEAGISDVLDKPFSPRRIRDLAVRWLDPSHRPAVDETQAAAPTPLDAAKGATSRDLDALPLLDPEVLDTLRALAKPNKPDLLDRILSAYRSDASGNLEKLRVAVRDADSKGIFQAAHSLKSASGNVGAHRLAAAARALETPSREGRLDDMPPLLARVEHEFRALSAELDTKRQAASGQGQG